MLVRTPSFLNYNLTSTDPSVIKLADDLLTEIGVKKKKYQQKKDLMICILSNFKLGCDSLPGTMSTFLIPLSKEFYSKYPKRYKRKIMSYHNTYEILNGLLNHKYIIRFGGMGVGGSKIPYDYRPAPPLIKKLAKINNSAIDIQRPVSLLVLREKINDKPVEKDFNDTRKTLQMTKDLTAYTDLRETSKIGLIDVPKKKFDKHKKFLLQNILEDLNTLKPINGKYTVTFRKSYLVRIFNNNFSLGGRFYRGVESTMPSELRKYISINGAKTFEWDYSAMHIRMLYHIKKINYRGNPYKAERNMPDEKRDVYKLVGLISINSNSVNKVLNTLKSELVDNGLVKLLPDNSKLTRQDLINRFKKHNSKIGDMLFTSKGAKLQFRDSKIANNILKEFAARKILVLCVHDSFIIEMQHKKDLKRAMCKFYKKEMGFLPVIK